MQNLANQVHLSSGYMSDLLRSYTGLKAQQYIQHQLIEKGKALPNTSTLSVSEIAYTLGLEHPKSFSRLFKKITQQTPF